MAGGLALAGLSGPALAQAAAETVEGTVVALTAGEATVKTADSHTVTVRVTPKTQYMTSQPIGLEGISAGSYVGSTNMDRADGSGVSSEVHVFNGPAPGQGINVPWGGGAMMTNGNVAKVVQGPEGAQLEIDYGKGSKKVLVPRATPVVLLAPTTDAALLKTGAVVKVRGARQPDGSIEAGYMTVQIPRAR
ncbi:MAG: hypothetical protein JWQ29_661 [Phenylobacterium sp.]|nr:hypothetical protein [Phenylobacterium sp.]